MRTAHAAAILARSLFPADTTQRELSATKGRAKTDFKREPHLGPM